MTDQTKDIAFEDLVNLSFEEAIELHGHDMAMLEEDETARQRHVLELDTLPEFINPIDRNLEAIKQVLKKRYLEPEQLQKILDMIKGVNTLAPSFSRECEFIGRQFYLGGGYYEEIMFLPDELIIKNFVKRYGDPEDMRQNLKIYQKMMGIFGIDELVVPIVGVDEKNGLVIYTHFGKNILQAIKSQDEERAFETVKEGLSAHLRLAFKLTENKNKFGIKWDERLPFMDEEYVFTQQKPLKESLSCILEKICPGMPKKDRKEFLKKFSTGKEDKYVIPLDPRTANTVIDIDNSVRVCDIDGIVLGNIHHLLHGYLARIGKVQYREEQLVDFAYEAICERNGSQPAVEGMQNFRSRYHLQKPAENLARAERLLRRTKRDAFKDSAENVTRLNDLANLYFNRAVRDLGRIGMSDFAYSIIQNIRDERLFALDDSKYLSLEAKLCADEHDYASMLLRDKINRRLSEFRFEPEVEHWPAKVWRYARIPIAAALGLTLFVTLVSYLPKVDGEINTQNMLSYPFLGLQIQQRIASRDFDYTFMLGDFDNSEKERISKEVAGYLKEYINVKHNNNFTIDAKSYNQFFGWDMEHSPTMGDNYNADTLALRLCMIHGLPPQFFRAAIHASITSRELAEKAKKKGYVGNIILVPMETVREIVFAREIAPEFKIEQLDQKYWEDDKRGMEIAALANQSMMSYLGKGNVAAFYARLFAGNRAVDKAMVKTGSDDFVDFGKELNPIAQELVMRAVSYHPFMVDDALPVRKRQFFDPGDYSYEPLMREWLIKNGFTDSQH